MNGSPAQTFRLLWRCAFWGCAYFLAAALFSSGWRAHADDSVWPKQAHIKIADLGEGDWRVEYRLAHPLIELDLGPSLNGFRQRDWSIVTHGVTLETRDSRDYLVASNSAAAVDKIAIRIKAQLLGLKKHYEPIRPLGADGALVYTGHFWPWRRGRRMDVVFSISPRAGAHVSVFGDAYGSLERWMSPYRHPAFVYVGPLRAREGALSFVVTDPRAPVWLREEMETAAAPILGALRDMFGADLKIKPNVFLAFQEGGPYGLLRYSGDALPGQFQLSLYGGGWDGRSDLGADLLHRALAHEGTHLWQSETRPKGEQPGWIHEGAAEAIAAEALVKLGWWSAADNRRDFTRARKQCAKGIQHGSLNSAETRGAFRALYACGRIMLQIAADVRDGAPTGEGSVTGFWKAFADRADAAGGYDAALFYTMVADAGGEPLARAFRRFARTPFARADQEIAALIATAQTAAIVDPAAQRPLAGSAER